MLLELYLKYSDTHPLKLRIYDRMNERSIDPPESLELETYLGQGGFASFRNLMLHMTRCTHLELDINWRVLSLIGGLVDVSFPLLQAFSCKTLFEIDEHGVSQWFWRAIHAASQLRVVYTKSIVGFDTFPFHQLTSLQGHLLRRYQPCPACATDLPKSTGPRNIQWDQSLLEPTYPSPHAKNYFTVVNPNPGY
ncbi:hypothetical protein MPER_11491 [Moniliophthora perniciosa FA553]|nr:hypothetical protein MPER_11491 [Moniliophthora perniciosa FA553]